MHGHPQSLMRTPLPLLVLTLTLALAVLPGLQACSPSLHWREVTPPHSGGLTMAFPCKPDHQERTVAITGLPGEPVRLHLLACQADDVTWAVSYFDAGTPERRLLALAALREALWRNTSATGAPQARQEDLGPVQVPGMTAHPDAHSWWMQGQRPASSSEMAPVQLKAWQFSRGLTAFQVSASARSLRPDDPRLEAFEQGLTFLRRQADN